MADGTAAEASATSTPLSCPVTPPQPAAAEASWTEWPEVFAALSPCLCVCFGEAFLRYTLEDQADGLPLAVLDARADLQVVFSTYSLGLSTGWTRPLLQGKKELKWLRLPQVLQAALNSQAWETLERLRARLAQHEAGKPLPEAATVLLMSLTPSGIPFWNIVHASPVPPTSRHGGACHYLLLVMIQLEAPIDRELLEGPHAKIELATATAAVARGELNGALAGHNADPGSRHPHPALGALAQAVESVRTVLVHLHEDAREAGGYVPKLGWPCVEAFDKLHTLGKIRPETQAELIKAWELKEEDMPQALSGTIPVDVTCFVSDPNGVDCPLVYISAPFEELTGYSRLWALGRNWRFLNPSGCDLFEELNRSELSRISRFVQQTEAGCMLSLLLMTRADGRHFWSVLYLEHVYPTAEGPGGQHGPRYIFNALTRATLQQDALDMVVLQELAGANTGGIALERLRYLLREKEKSFTPSRQAVRDLLFEVCTAWLREVGRRIERFWELGHFVPKVGLAPTASFSAYWPLLVDSLASFLNEVIGLDSAKQKQLRANIPPDGSEVAYSVSDPHGVDCPQVFMMPQYQELTGYDSAFGLGRNWRYLLPAARDLNEVCNAEEAERAPAQVGLRPTFALLLLQRSGGERYWTICCTQRGQVGSQDYLLRAMIELHGIPMPSWLVDATRLLDAAAPDEEALARERLESFRAPMRALRARLTARLPKALRLAAEDSSGVGALPRLAAEFQKALAEALGPFCRQEAAKKSEARGCGGRAAASSRPSLEHLVDSRAKASAESDMPGSPSTRRSASASPGASPAATRASASSPPVAAAVVSDLEGEEPGPVPDAAGASAAATEGRAPDSAADAGAVDKPMAQPAAPGGAPPERRFVRTLHRLGNAGGGAGSGASRDTFTLQEGAAEEGGCGWQGAVSGSLSVVAPDSSGRVRSLCSAVEAETAALGGLSASSTADSVSLRAAAATSATPRGRPAAVPKAVRGLLDKGWSAAEISDLLGLEASTVTQLLAGTETPGP